MPQTLYLIDAYAQIFRAYYAIRNGMRSPVTGEPTHAVFGFAAMLLKLLGQCQPDYVVVATDLPGKTFRDELYAEYKGTRRATPDDLTSQVPRVHELIERFGIPLVGQPGLEADDVIASICAHVLGRPEHADVSIRIVSKDKDLEQLLGDRVTMFDVHTDMMVDTAALLANKGITPEQVVDVLALTGDTVDNVPGVAGIGLKTAAQLVQQFGSVDGILANVHALTGKKREALEQARERLALSRTLVTLRRDPDLPFALDAARVGAPDPARLIPFFQQLGFHRFQEEVRKLAGAPAAAVGAPAVSAGALTSQNGTAAVPAVPPLTRVNGSAAAPAPAAAIAAVAAGAAGGDPVPPPLGEAARSAGEGAAADTAASPHPNPLPEGDGSGIEGEGKGFAGERTGSAPGLSAYSPSTANYRAVVTRAELEELVATLRRQDLVAVDTETTGLERDAKLCGISFSWREGQGVYVPVRSPAPERHLDEATVIGGLRPVLEDESIQKCGHNLKFDAGVLRRSGAQLRGIVFDSLLASILLDPAQPAHKLDTLAMTQLGYQMIPITALIGTGVEQASMETVPLEQIVPYAAEDADVALRLCRHLTPLLEQMDLLPLLRQVESPLVGVLAEMEGNGIVCDPEELLRQGAALGTRVDDVRRQVREIAGSEFQLDSPKQLAEVLFDKLGLPSVKKTKTGRSTDAEVLDRLAAQEDRNDARTSVPRLILEYRQLNKLISTYLGNLRDAVDPADGRIHTTFHQLVAATGRLASQNPNLQNIPVRTDVGRQIRKAFLAPPGHVLLCADYSQIELRLLAHLSEDAALLDAFANDQDIHTAVAAQVFGVAPEAVTREQRGHAKTINFGIIYGVTPYGLARRIEGLDVAAATRLIADYKARFPGIDEFLRRCVEYALQHGYVATLLGRRRAIPELQSSSYTTRNLGERLAINSVVQGSAADLIKVAMVNVQRRIDRERLPLRLLLQIHDELVLESPVELAAAHAAAVREEMERAMALKVPLRAEVGVGADWMSAK